MIDRVAAKLGRKIFEVPVGFKWFVDGLLDGSLGFAGEESAGARFSTAAMASVWTTDKDGIIPCLLAAEKHGPDGPRPGGGLSQVNRGSLARRPTTGWMLPRRPNKRNGWPDCHRNRSKSPLLAGEPIEAMLTQAPGNHAPIGGLKVVTGHGWFAARPSGTESIYKLYAESFRGADHLSGLRRRHRPLSTRS